jgi:hypothetical protein
MNNYEKDFYGRQTWIFHVQSVEDFEKQLKEWELAHSQVDDKVDVEDTTMAQEMLQAIGIKTK